MKAKAIVFSEPNEVTFGEVDMPQPGPGQLLTRTLLTGVSTGTELRVLRGMEDSTFPLIPGYENVGEVIAVGEGVDLPEGSRVFVGGSDATGPYARIWGAQMEYVLTGRAEATPVPEGVDPFVALHTRVLSVAVHGINRAQVKAGETVAIVGQGLIGNLALQIARARGAVVIAVDRLEDRLKVAEEVGADHTVNAAEEDVQEAVMELSEGGADVAVEATGVAELADSVARLVRPMPWDPPYPPRSRVLLLASYSDTITFSYNPTLFTNEPDIIPSRCWTAEETAAAMRLLASGVVRPDVLDHRIVDVEEAPRAYADLKDRKVTRVVFRWREGQ
jgi:2-desacetyl-2-hydroxyethyl bacteriochlorophyllide A dehydrogenase